MSSFENEGKRGKVAQNPGAPVRLLCRLPTPLLQAATRSSLKRREAEFARPADQLRWWYW